MRQIAVRTTVVVYYVEFSIQVTAVEAFVVIVTCILLHPLHLQAITAKPEFEWKRTLFYIYLYYIDRYRNIEITLKRMILFFIVE